MVSLLDEDHYFRIDSVHRHTILLMNFQCNRDKQNTNILPLFERIECHRQYHHENEAPRCKRNSRMFEAGITRKKFRGGFINGLVFIYFLHFIHSYRCLYPEFAAIPFCYSH